MSYRPPHALSVLFALTLALIAQQARADQLSVHFETYGEDEPAEVCIATAFAGFRATSVDWAPPTQKAGECGSLTPTEADATEALKPPVPPKLFCQKSGDGKGGRAVLAVSHALVGAFLFERGAVTLQINPDKASTAGGVPTQHAPAQIALMAGQYHEQSALPLRLTDGTQVVTIPLVPMCVQRTIEVPEVTCEDTKDTKTTIGDAHAAIPAGRNVSIVVPNAKTTGGTLSLHRCKHDFAAEWSGPVPPKRLEFETRQWTFRWHPNCLSPVNQCPQVVLPGASVSCDTPPQPKEGQCTYSCSGAARFPVQVQLSFADPDATFSRVWNETLSTPGELLLGYISQDQRRVALKWNWQEALELDPVECKKSKTAEAKAACLHGYDARHGVGCSAPGSRVASSSWLAERNHCVEAHNRTLRESRAQRTAGDLIDHTELRTPEGTVHNVHYAATQIRIPELDCNDFVSYRYVGERQYEEQVVQVDQNGQVELDDPGRFRSDNWSLASAVGGGARYTRGAGPLVFGPQAEADLILVWRKPRDWIEAMDAELRVAAILGTQPYCSRSKSDADGGSCSAGDWERIPYWRFPITIGLNWQLPMTAKTRTIPLTIGLAFGPAFTEYLLSSDGPKVQRPVLWTTRGHVGYRLSHHVSLEAYTRFMFGEQPVATVFDDAGVARHGPIEGTSTLSIFYGAIGRLDDIF